MSKEDYKLIIPFGVVLTAVIISIMVNINKEGFTNNETLPMNKLSPISGYPIFLNEYPSRLGVDPMLINYIRTLKSKLEQIPRGIYQIDNNGQYVRNLTKPTNPLCPVIIIPGLGATTIYGSWNNDGFKKIWPSSDEYKDKIGIINNDGKLSNINGVKTILDSFGSHDFGVPTEKLIETLKAMGYESGKNMFGAGYDFRKITDEEEINSWCMSLTNLIEKTCSLTGKRVVLIGHDMGCQIVNYYLVKSLKEWKDRYIKSFINVSGTYGGTPKSLRTLLSGHKEYKNFSGLQMMLPYSDIYGDNPLVSINENVYTSYNIDKLLGMVGIKETNNTKNMRYISMKPPGVRVYMICGEGLDTESSYQYDRTFLEEPKVNYPVYQINLQNKQKFNYSDYYVGDGTMPKFALEYPIFWSKYQKEPVFFQFFRNTEHTKILSMEGPLKYIVGSLTE